MSRFLLVELEEDLTAHRTTQIGVWNSLRLVSGVRSITDLSLVSQPTLDAILYRPEPALRRKRKARHDAG
jgi:hypothetical protein